MASGNKKEIPNSMSMSDWRVRGRRQCDSLAEYNMMEIGCSSVFESMRLIQSNQVCLKGWGVRATLFDVGGGESSGCGRVVRD